MPQMGDGGQPWARASKARIALAVQTLGVLERDRRVLALRRRP